MCAHAVDDIGYPLDPELRSLQAYLGNLAAMWRHANATLNSKRKAELVNEYHHILATLYERGWDDALDVESELPDEFMPQAYFDRAKKRREAEIQRLRENGVLAELQRFRETGQFRRNPPTPHMETPPLQRYVPIAPETRQGAFSMDWRSKLRLLIQALHQGHPTLRFSLRSTDPLQPQEIDHLATQLGGELPPALRALYTITDGLVIGLHIAIGGLRSSCGGEPIAQLNERLLPTVQATGQTNAIRLLFGSDNGLHGTFGWTADGAVVALGPHHLDHVRPLAPSLEAFFETVCLGPAYTAHYVPNPLWMSVLQEFGFLPPDADLSAAGVR